MDIQTSSHSPNRIALACQRCNQKKVKCNAHGGFPCAGCRAKNVECIPIQSGRGKYVRKNVRRSVQKAANDLRLREHEDDHTVNNPGIHDQESASLGPSPGSTVSHDASASRDPNLFAQVAEQRISSVQHPITNSTRTVFLGEAFSLTYVVNDVLAPFLNATPNFQRRLHFPIAEHSIDAIRLRNRKLSLDQKKILQERGIYHVPPTIHKRKLLEIYFDWFNPAFPVLDCESFISQSDCGEVSLLIENAVLMIAVTICTTDDLTAASLPNRYAAREMFYQQARVLFDSDTDLDKIDLITGAFLLSFWWGGPDEPKDTWYWVGIAASLAQSLGMHRSTSKSGMDMETTKRWRRIWWSIRMREALVSGSIGRPLHFAERDCDVEMLQPEDIDASDVHALYACQMARLCQIMTRVITSRYAAEDPVNPNERTELEDSLLTFRQNIPSLLQYSSAYCTSQRGLWSSMLTMAYNYATILLCRPTRSTGTRHRTEPWGHDIPAQNAANENTRIMEDLLMGDMIRLCQIHTIPSTSNALVMHLRFMCISRSVHRSLAENRIRICMLGLDALQKCWPVGSWVFLMFKTVVGKLQKKCNMETFSILPSGTEMNRRQQHTYVQPIGSQTSGSGAPPSNNPQTIPSQLSTTHLDLTGNMHSTILPHNRGPYAGFPLEDSSGQDWAILQSLFDLDPYQPHPHDLEQFFDQLDMPS